MSKHTPEPWVVAAKALVRLDHAYLIESVDHHDFEYGATLAATSQQDALRIVACVNACAGLPTEQLEASPLGGVLNGVAGLIAQRDELLAALEALDDCYSETSRDDLTRSELQRHKAVRADVTDIIVKLKGGAS